MQQRLSNTIFTEGELITVAGNGAIPEKASYVGGISQQIAESSFRNTASGARMHGMSAFSHYHTKNIIIRFFYAQKANKRD